MPDLDTDLARRALAQEWRSNAVCTPERLNRTQQDIDEWFFPTRGGSSKTARRICEPCPVRDECLAFAMITNELHGIFGGTSERQRRRLRQELNVKPPSAYGYAGLKGTGGRPRNEVA